MADPSVVARQFVDYYYQTFDANRASLGPLYKDISMLSFEGQQTSGSAAIVEKLTSLPFQKVRHVISTCDAQPGSPNGSILVTVTGQLQIDEETTTQFFTQTFHLYPEGASFFVYNDIFRLVLGA
ncbi:nuclear transport factor 2 [Fimicolochytrium jonesii]|uniref:nuclear transport factor 2 n=1 Tax=Fimicolochytrium jonesii TaxID=1396493 RepID=UPI0022FDE14C|nr:nuclear transport factor 2 [Fimicolochytrium jonesii]KAI8825713.1 nuclear transport factor 2 [Fimicolochytrium jonesii]